jgi:hypothetical protein
LGEEVLGLISNAFGKGRAPNYSHLSPPTKNGQKSNKNLKVIIEATKAQLPK